MRLIYTCLLYLAVPFILLRLFWRSFRLPAYRRRLGERFGFYPFQLEKSIWIHAVSVGETIAAVPLIKQLIAHYPHIPILVTTTTPTGAEQVTKLLGDQVHHAFLPYDLPTANRRFLLRMQPCIAVLMETELWPNLIASCRARHIPICLVNARLSDASAKRYLKIATLTQRMLQSIQMIAAISNQDANHFKSLGADAKKIKITGNIKYDLEVPAHNFLRAQSIRQHLGKRFVWIAASTHQGEEEMMLVAHQLLLQQDPQALLILVPRHPDRFAQVEQLCQAQLTVTKRSEDATGGNITQQTQVYLGDTMGELLLLYALSDVCVVGGSLIPHGGHNILEPAALGKPVISGPSLFNFTEIKTQFINADALQIVNDSKQLVNQLIHLKNNSNLLTAFGDRAKAVVEKNRGALQSQLTIISSFIT